MDRTRARVRTAGLSALVLGCALACASGPPQPAAPPPPTPPWAKHVERVAATPPAMLDLLVVTPEGVFGAGDGQIWRLEPGGAHPIAATPAPGVDEVSGLVWFDGGLVWATLGGVWTASPDGAARRLFEGEVRALAASGDDLAWANPEEVWRRGPGGAPVRVGEANVLYPDQLAVAGELVAWTDHNAGEVWAAAEGAAPRRVGHAVYRPHSLSVHGDRIAWAGSEVNLLGGREAGVHLAQRRGDQWQSAPLPLAAIRGVTLAGDCLVAPARCSPLQPPAWIDIDLEGASAPLALGPEHAYWVEWSVAEDASVVVRAPIALCCAPGGAGSDPASAPPPAARPEPSALERPEG